MNVRNILLAVLFVIVGLPLAGIFAIDLFSMAVFGIYASPVAEQMEKHEAKRAAIQAELDLVVNESRKNIGIYRSIKRFSEFNDSRFAGVTFSLNENSVRQLLKKAAVDTAGVDLEAMATVLAPELAKRECEILKATFASGCRVISSSARVMSLGDLRKKKFYKEYATFSFRLQFVQKDGFGDFVPDTRVKVEKIRHSLPLSGKKYRLANMSKHENARRKFYRDLQSTCDTIRLARKNCAIQFVSLKSWVGDRKSPKQMIRGSGTLIVLDFLDAANTASKTSTKTILSDASPKKASNKVPVFQLRGSKSLAAQ